jgi:hypothetical protein
MLVSGRAMVSVHEFFGEPIAESNAERAERREVMRHIRALFHAERRARRHLAIRASVGRIMRTPRTSHRVGASKPTTSGSSDDDGEPPRRYERALVATVRPDGSPCEVVVEIDPLNIDPTAMVFAARRAAGHSVDSATRGLDDVRWTALHPYGRKVGAA